MDLEEPLEGLASYEWVEAAIVEAKRAEDVGQRSEDFSGCRNIFDEECVEHHVGQAVVLQRRQKGRLLEHKKVHDFTIIV